MEATATGGGDAAATAAGTGAPRRAADSRDDGGDGHRDGRAGGRSTGRRRGPRRGGGARGQGGRRRIRDGRIRHRREGHDGRLHDWRSSNGSPRSPRPTTSGRGGRSTPSGSAPRRGRGRQQGDDEGHDGGRMGKKKVRAACSATATNDATGRGKKWIWGSKMPPPGAKSMLPGAAQRRRGWRRRIYTTWSSDSMLQMEACCIDRGPKGNIYRVQETPQTLEYVK